MQTFSLYICEKIFRIEEEFGSFLRFCRGYIVKDPSPEPDYIIHVSLAELERLHLIADTNWLDLLSGYVILHKIASNLLRDERTLFVHGCVVAKQESAFMFSAPSGTGKTTHSMLWTKNIPDAYVLNGDKPFISTGEKIVAWGSPWCGSERFNQNKGVELKAICFLERAEKNRITEITPDDAIPMLAAQTADPDPSDYHTKIWIMEALERLRGRVKFYRYEMNNHEEEEAFHTTYDVLSKL